MLSGGRSYEHVQMLMIHAILLNVNDTSKKLDCGTCPYHEQEETPPLEGLNKVGPPLESCFHVVIVM